MGIELYPERPKQKEPFWLWLAVMLSVIIAGVAVWAALAEAAWFKKPDGKKIQMWYYEPEDALLCEEDEKPVLPCSKKQIRAFLVDRSFISAVRDHSKGKRK